MIRFMIACLLYTSSNIDIINDRIEELTELAKSYDIEIYSGAEVFLNHEYLDMIDSKAFNTCLLYTSQ